jgi:hypothetical protein
MFARMLRPALCGVVVVAALFVPEMTATAAPAPTVTTQESGCTEQAFTRSLVRDAVDPLIPDEFDLTPTFTPPGSPARVAGLINVVTCNQVALDGAGGAYFAKHPTTTTVIYSASLLDGTGYVLLYATDNPVLAARYRQLGWPVELLTPGTSSKPVIRPDGSERQVWSLKGPGWDGVVDGSVPASLSPVTSSTFELVHETDGTVLYLCYANEASVTPNVVWFDLSNTPVADFAAVPVLPTGFEFPGWYITGSQTVTLTTERCPGLAP